jgi:hypothetical protein
MEHIRIRVPLDKWRHDLPVYIGRTTGPGRGVYVRVGTAGRVFLWPPEVKDCACAHCGDHLAERRTFTTSFTTFSRSSGRRPASERYVSLVADMVPVSALDEI